MRLEISSPGFAGMDAEVMELAEGFQFGFGEGFDLPDLLFWIVHFMKGNEGTFGNGFSEGTGCDWVYQIEVLAVFDICEHDVGILNDEC